MATMAAFLLPLLNACELETSDNGDLDGLWHLEQVDTLTTGGTLDVSNELKFWAFQMNLMNLSNKTTGSNFVMRFNHAERHLRVYDIHIDQRLEGDPTLEDVARIAPFGINALDETFQVETLSGSHMTLSSGILRLHFRKM